MSARKTGVLLGIPIDKATLSEAVDDAVHKIESTREQIIFACANPHSLVVAQSDRDFSAALINADLVVADGVGVTLMAKIAGVRIGPRITGHDYFCGVLNELERRGSGRIFFFGSSQNVLDAIGSRFKSEFPSLTLCGVLSPPFGGWSVNVNDEMVEAINNATPDVLWVGMTAPRQEKWVEENRHQINAPVIGSIGAVFDFYAGTYPRAPAWVCRMGMEWLFRLVKEPKRMWRRNFISTPKFVLMVLWRRLLGKTHESSYIDYS